MPELSATLTRHLTDAGTGWSMGSFGAIAEFHQDRGEPAQTGPSMRATARGGLRLTLPEGVVPVAYETPLKDPARWSQGVALCLPAAAAAMNGRAALTERGPDAGALREQDRGAILFDMGLAQPQVDFCIRTDDPGLLAVLRAHLGQSLMDPANPAMGAILKAHPHRVALTRVGRVEVYQKIGGPDTGGVSPPGPHTHVLPKLMRAGRTHSANIALPDGLVPCAFFYPANPLADPMGHPRAFDPGLHLAFQALVAEWAPLEHRRAKAVVEAALALREGPERAAPASRAARKALRVALRQARQIRGDDPLLTRWIAVHDTPGGNAHDAEAESEDDTADRAGH